MSMGAMSIDEMRTWIVSLTLNNARNLLCRVLTAHTWSPNDGLQMKERTRCEMKWLLLLIYACLVIATASPACADERALQGTHHNRHLHTLTAYNASKDDPQQLLALQQLYSATNGSGWLITQASSASGIVPWLTPGSSYCRWLGVSCCQTSPLTLVSCNNSNSVVVLNLAGFGLSGQLPLTTPALPEISVLSLEDNPGLTGGLPDNWLGPTLLWLSTQNTSLVACQGGPAASLPAPCPLSSTLSLSSQSTPLSTTIQCPPAQLVSFYQQTLGMPSSLAAIITQPYPAPSIPGAVFADPGFTNGIGCTCAAGVSGSVYVDNRGQLQCGSGGGGDGGGGSKGMTTQKWIIVVVLVAVVPHILVAAIAYIYMKHKAYLHRLLHVKEATMQHKRGKVPGTPGLVLQEGRGLVPLADTMVTWVCTDVASSTILWELDATAMDSAIDMHNRAIRDIMYEFGGHEIRNEGDSFVISFHEALDGVFFCLKAQERLQTLAWPSSLLMQPPASTITIGDLVPEGAGAGAGHVIMAGLRVRMGINTGMPEDVFLHDLTEHVDYRGQQYDLTAEICDLAKGGQILIGPKTYLSWMRHSADHGPDPLEMAWRENSQLFGGSALSRRALLSTGGSFRTTMLRRQLGVDSGLGSTAPDGQSGSLSMHRQQDNSAGDQSHHADQTHQLNTQNTSAAGNKVFGGMFPSLSSLRLTTRALVTSASWKTNSLGGSSRANSPGRVATTDAQPSTQPGSGFDDVSHLQAALMHPDMRVDSTVHSSAAPSPGAIRPPHVPSSSLMTRLSMSRGPGDWPGGAAGGGVRGEAQLEGHNSPTGAMFNPDRHVLIGNCSSGGALGTLDHVPSMARSMGDYGEQQDFGMDRMAAIQHGEGQGLEHLVQSMDHGGQQHQQHVHTGLMGVCMRCMACVKDVFHQADENIPWEEQVTIHQNRKKQLSVSHQGVRGVTIDMGFYEWNANPQGRSSKAQADSDPDGEDGGQGGAVMVHLVQVLPASLASRALLFDWPIELGDDSRWEKVGPGFFDAPGSHALTFGCLRDVLAAYQVYPERPLVALTFTSIEGIKELAAVNVMLAQETTQLHNACVRETLSACNGYECKESDGAFVLAFHEASTALEWALTVQLALMEIPWSIQLLSSHELFGEVWDAQAGRLVFRGARARVGVYSGNVDRVIPHIKTGRADYFGQPVNRAARLMSAAHGGQVVCDQAIVQSVFDQWARKYSAVREAEVQHQMIGPVPFLTAGQLAGGVAAGVSVKSGSGGLLGSGGLVKAMPRILKSSMSSARNKQAAADAAVAAADAAAGRGAPGRSTSKRTVSWFPELSSTRRKSVVVASVPDAGGETGRAVTGVTGGSARLEAVEALVSEMRVARSFSRNPGSRLRHTGHHATNQNAPAHSTTSSAAASPRSVYIPPPEDTTRRSDPQFHQHKIHSPQPSPNHAMASESSWANHMDMSGGDCQRSWHGVRLATSVDMPGSQAQARSPKTANSGMFQEINRLLDTPTASAGAILLSSPRNYPLGRQHSKASSSQVGLDIISAADIRVSAWDPDTHTRSGARRMSANVYISPHASSGMMMAEGFTGHCSVTSGRMRSSLRSGPSTPSVASGVEGRPHAPWASGPVTGASLPSSPRGTQEALSGGGAPYPGSGGGADTGAHQPGTPRGGRYNVTTLRRSSRHANPVATPVTPLDSQELPVDDEGVTAQGGGTPPEGTIGGDQDRAHVYSYHPHSVNIQHVDNITSEVPSHDQHSPVNPGMLYLHLNRDPNTPREPLAASSTANPAALPPIGPPARTSAHRTIIAELNTSRSSRPTPPSARSTPGNRSIHGHRMSRTSRATNATNRSSLSSVTDMRGVSYGDMEDEDVPLPAVRRTTGGAIPSWTADWSGRSSQPRKSLLGSTALNASAGGDSSGGGSWAVGRRSLHGAGGAQSSSMTNIMGFGMGSANAGEDSGLSHSPAGSASISAGRPQVTQSASQLMVWGALRTASTGLMADARLPIPRLTGVAATQRSSVNPSASETPVRSSLAGQISRKGTGLLSALPSGMERSVSAASRLSSRTLEQLGISSMSQLAVMPAGRKTALGTPMARVHSVGGISLEQLMLQETGNAGGSSGGGGGSRRTSRVDRTPGEGRTSDGAISTVKKKMPMRNRSFAEPALMMKTASKMAATENYGSMLDMSLSSRSGNLPASASPLSQGEHMTDGAGAHARYVHETSFMSNISSTNTPMPRSSARTVSQHNLGPTTATSSVSRGMLSGRSLGGGMHLPTGSGGDHLHDGDFGPVLDGIVLSPRGDSSVRLRLRDSSALSPPASGSITSPPNRRRSTKGGSRRSSARAGSVTLSPSNTKVNLGDGRDSASGPDTATSAVIAECFKISKSPSHEDGASMSAPTSITMIKYSVRDGGDRQEDDLAPVDEDEAQQPRAAKVIPTVPVEVCVWSLGSFRLKGVTELMKVVQLVPRELEQRIDHLQKGALNKGKARCVQRFMVRMDRTTIPLPDVTKLPCILGPNGNVDDGEQQLHPHAPNPMDNMTRDPADSSSHAHGGMTRAGTDEGDGLGGAERPVGDAATLRRPPSMMMRESLGVPQQRIGSSSTQQLEMTSSGVTSHTGYKSMSVHSSVAVGGLSSTRENSLQYLEPMYSGNLGRQQYGIGHAWHLDTTTAEESLAPISEVASPHVPGIGHLSTIPSTGLPPTNSGPRLASQPSVKLQEMRPAALILPKSPSDFRSSDAHSSVLMITPPTNTVTTNVARTDTANTTAHAMQQPPQQQQGQGQAGRAAAQHQYSAAGGRGGQDGSDEELHVGGGAAGSGQGLPTHELLSHLQHTHTGGGGGGDGVALDPFFAREGRQSAQDMESIEPPSLALLPATHFAPVPSYNPDGTRASASLATTALAYLSVVPSTRSHSHSQVRASHDSAETALSARIPLLLGGDGQRGGQTRRAEVPLSSALMQMKALSKSASQAAAAARASAGSGGRGGAEGLSTGRLSEGALQRGAALEAVLGSPAREAWGALGEMRQSSGAGGRPMLPVPPVLAVVPLHQVRSGDTGSGVTGSSPWPLAELAGPSEEQLENERQQRVERWAHANAVSVATTPVRSIHQAPSAPSSDPYSNYEDTNSVTGMSGVSANMVRVALDGGENAPHVVSEPTTAAAEAMPRYGLTGQRLPAGAVMTDQLPDVRGAVHIHGGSGSLPGSRVLKSSRGSNTARATITSVRQLVEDGGNSSNRPSRDSREARERLVVPPGFPATSAERNTGTTVSGVPEDDEEVALGPSFRFGVARGSQGQHVAAAAAAALASASSPRPARGSSPGWNAELMDEVVGVSAGSVTFQVAPGEMCSPRNGLGSGRPRNRPE